MELPWLFICRQQGDNVVAAGDSQSAVKGDHTTAMSARQPEKVPVRDLLRGGGGPHFAHCCRRYGIRPELVVAACSSEQQKSIGGCFGRPRPAGQLRADTNRSKLGDGAGRPALITFCREPLDRRVVMLMLRNKQRNQHVDVQKADHGRDYSPAPSARRSTSSTDSVGAPGRRGNTGTPRSNRTSASAIRLSSASTNSSTCCPDWLARFASRSFNAASTVIVAFGITSLSHDVAKSGNCDARLPFVAQRHDLSPLGWAQIWAHDSSDAANHSRISTFRGLPSLPWAQGVAGSNPVAPTTFREFRGDTGVTARRIVPHPHALQREGALLRRRRRRRGTHIEPH
jgi:hypothetical protein